MANKYQRLFCLKFGLKGRSFQPSPAKRRSKIMHAIGVLIKINAPSDCKLEGCPSNLSSPTPTHPQTITTKLNMATFLNVFDLLFMLLNLLGFHFPPLAAKTLSLCMPRSEYILKSHHVTVLLYHILLPTKYRRVVSHSLSFNDPQFIRIAFYASISLEVYSSILHCVFVLPHS